MEIKTINVLNLLLRREGFISLKELSLKTGLQERSVRYEIEKIKELIKDQTEVLLEQDRKKGFAFQATREQKEALVKQIGASDADSYLSNDERVAVISVLLLQEKERITQNRLMELFQVSPTTVKKDRRMLEVLLAEYHLNLQSDISRGYYISGPEQGKRNFIFQLVSQYIDLEHVLFVDNVRYGSKLEVALLEYLDKQEICRMKKQLIALYRRLKIQSSDIAFNQISLVLGIQRKRMAEGHIITDLRADSQYQKDHLHLITVIEQELIKTTLDSPERKYLTDYIMAFTGREQKDFLKIPNWLEIQLDTIGLIMEMERYTGGVFLTNQNIRETLFNHMEVLIHRIKSDIRIHNPLTAMVKEKYGYVYEFCRQAVGFLEEKYKKRISEEEIAYLTIYFYAYLEEREPLKVMVVCGQGLSTGHLLAENLKKQFPFHIIGVLSYFEKHTIKHLNVDLVISTIDVEGLEIPVLKVSPLLTKEDIDKIHEFLKQHQVPADNGTAQEEQLLGKLVQIAQECSKELDIVKFAEQVMDVLYEHKIISKRSFEQPMIKDVLTVDGIQLKQKASDWKEAITISAQPLIKNGAIEPRYIDAMITSIEQYGPYIVIAKNIALAHARPEDGVKAVGLSVVTLEPPIPFGNQDYDPVEMVICLAAVNSFSHLEVLSNIAEVISNQAYVEELKKCSTKEEFLEIIIKAEQEIIEQ